jgi:hypothetical protein
MKKISWTNIGFQIGALLVVLLITTIIFANSRSALAQGIPEYR